MKVTVIRTPDIECVSVELKNTNIKYKLLEMLKDYTLQRYYWRSIFDSSIIEYLEPKIFDAYIFCVDFIGKADEIVQILKEFDEKRHYLQRLENLYYNPITEDEIKQLALNIL